MAPTLRGIALSLCTLTPSFAAPPQVVTDTPVTQSLTAMVMDGIGTPALLLDKGSDPHDFQLRPSQAGALEGAALVIWIGPEMTPWLDGRIAPDASLALLDVTGTILQPATAGDEGVGAGHSRNPHAWLDPRNAGTWVRAIAARLSTLDPGDAATYAANADRAVARIAALDATLATRLAPARGSPFATYHDAYGYLAARYGLALSGSIASGDAHDPGAAHLADLEERLKGAACLFPETGHDPRAAETLAADTGIRLGTPLDPEGLGMEAGPALYPALMEALADAIVACAKGG